VSKLDIKKNQAVSVKEIKKTSPNLGVKDDKNKKTPTKSVPTKDHSITPTIKNKNVNKNKEIASNLDNNIVKKDLESKIIVKPAVKEEIVEPVIKEENDEPVIKEEIVEPVIIEEIVEPVIKIQKEEKEEIKDEIDVNLITPTKENSINDNYNDNTSMNIPQNLQSPRDNSSVNTTDSPRVVLTDKEKEDLIARKNILTTQVNDWVSLYTAERNGEFPTKVERDLLIGDTYQELKKIILTLKYDSKPSSRPSSGTGSRRPSSASNSSKKRKDSATGIYLFIYLFIYYLYNFIMLILLFKSIGLSDKDIPYLKARLAALTTIVGSWVNKFSIENNGKIPTDKEKENGLQETYKEYTQVLVALQMVYIHIVYLYLINMFNLIL
jgi:hypothetical protein